MKFIVIFFALYSVYTAFCNENILPQSHIFEFDDFTIYRLGSLSDVQTNSSPGSGLIGGGSDTNKAFMWQVENAYKGDFLILRAHGTDSYNQYVMDLSIAMKMKLNSVTTIVCKSRAASYDKTIIEYINNSEAIFFAGGDQSIYLNYWKNSPIELTIQKKIPFVTISGTSAGLAILGNWIYSASNGSTYSDESLLNPYNQYVTISSAFIAIPFLETVLTDTHFLTRDRMGRMISFVGRIFTDNSYSSTIHAIGIDEQTALLLNTTSGNVVTVGVSYAYICTATKSPSRCEMDTPLTFTDIPCVRLSGKNEDKFSFETWTGEGDNFTISIVNGKFTTSKYGD